jgi:CBS domain-containing membrane protein
MQATLAAGLIGLLSLATRTPFLFPALGASAFILISFPHLPAARMRNVVGSHLVGAAAGWLCFTGLGLQAGGATIVAGGGYEHVLAAALALGLTTGLLLALGLHHPPAGATTLIVALGFLPHAWQIAMVGASALLLVLLVRGLARIGPRAATGTATGTATERVGEAIR